MARTITTIQTEILDSLAANLPELTSTSKVSVYRLFAFVVATAIWSLEKLFDIFKEEQTTLADAQQVHTLQWYRQQALSFQDGYGLVWKDNKFQYDIEDEGAKVVKYCSVTESPGQLLLKIATEDETGNLLQLPLDVALRFETYMNQIKDAGNIIKVVNRPADQLNLWLDIYYDPLVLNSIGYSLLEANTKPVEIAISDYLKNMDFDGVFISNHLIDRLQRVPGVKDPVFRQADARYGLIDVTHITHYQPDSGYLQVVELNINYKINDEL